MEWDSKGDDEDVVGLGLDLEEEGLGFKMGREDVDFLALTLVVVVPIPILLDLAVVEDINRVGRGGCGGAGEGWLRGGVAEM